MQSALFFVYKNVTQSVWLFVYKNVTECVLFFAYKSLTKSALFLYIKMPPPPPLLRQFQKFMKICVTQGVKLLVMYG